MPRKKKDKYTPRADGRYYTLVNTGKRLENGKPERIPLYADTSAELEEKVAELKYFIRTGKRLVPSKSTVYEYATLWFKTFKSMRRGNTRAMYENVIETHIQPSIGHLPIKELTRTDCQLMINERFEHYETCNKIGLTMKQIEKSAVKDKIINEPFWDEITMPEKPASTKRPLLDIEKEAIKKADFRSEDAAFVHLLFGCGLRREEVIALKASDFDLKKRIVKIRHVITFDGNKPIFEELTKTKDGVRDLTIPISIYKKIIFYVRSRAGQEFLFTTQKGGMVTLSCYRKMWERIVKTLNAAVATKKEPEPITDLTAHIFRHNYATMLYYSGISELKAVEMMGHADGTMIKKVYAHLSEQEENTVEKLDKKIFL